MRFWYLRKIFKKTKGGPFEKFCPSSDRFRSGHPGYDYDSPNITDSGLIDVINNCSQINSIVFNCRPNISHKTIDALIALALRKPDIRFKHSFNDMERGGHQSYHSFTYTAIDLKGFDLPKNLIINIF